MGARICGPFIPTTGAVPIGGIILWSGSVATIPAGYALCDGNSGTPDLRSSFVLGAGGAYNPGATGGSSAGLTQHDHSFGVNITGGGGGSLDAGTAIDAATLGGTYASGGSVTIGGSGGGNTYTTDTTPPYYALAYIQRTT